jgi:hypothetical protein
MRSDHGAEGSGTRKTLVYAVLTWVNIQTQRGGSCLPPLHTRFTSTGRQSSRQRDHCQHGGRAAEEERDPSWPPPVPIPLGPAARSSRLLASAPSLPVRWWLHWVSPQLQRRPTGGGLARVGATPALQWRQTKPAGHQQTRRLVLAHLADPECQIGDRHAQNKGVGEACCRWIHGVMQRRNKNVAAVALANKNARIVWGGLALDWPD